MASRSGITVPRLGMSPIANALFYNATGDYVDLGATNFNFANNDGWTISAWVYMEDTTGVNKAIFSRRLQGGNQTGYQFSTNQLGRVFLAITSVITTNSLVVNSGGYLLPPRTWTHLVWTYDGSLDASGLKLYANSVNRALTTNTNNLTGAIDSGTNAYIGSITTSAQIWDGYITDLLVLQSTGNSNAVLSASQVKDLYSVGQYPTANLYAYFPFSDGSGSTLTDTSGNGRNGTITGAIWTTSYLPRKASARAKVSTARTVLSSGRTGL